MIRVILLVTLIVFLLATALSSLFFYKGFYTPPQVQPRTWENVAVPSPAIGTYQDTFSTAAPSRVLIDRLHSNDFTPSELNVLLQRLSARGATIDFLQESDEERVDALQNRLAGADVFIVISPWRVYTQEETRIVRRFVETGGRLLLVVEPTREHNMNSLAMEFGLTFRKDYLYNMKENEGNFRQVRFRDFEKAEVTQGLKEVVLFTAGSIIPVERGIIAADDNTFSILSEGKERLAVAALSVDSRVMALADLTFLTEPYSSYRDNSRFISNIADFLTKGERTHYLRDFPNFFQHDVRIGYGDVALLDSALGLKNLLTNAGQQVTLEKGSEAVAGGINLVLFDGAQSVAAFLSEAGITIGKEKISIQKVGDFDRKDRSILYLSRAKKPYTLILLADGPKAMGDMVANLKSGEFRDLLISDVLTIHPLPTAAATPTPTTTPTVTSPPSTPAPAGTPSPKG